MTLEADQFRNCLVVFLLSLFLNRLCQFTFPDDEDVHVIQYKCMNVIGGMNFSKHFIR